MTVFKTLFVVLFFAALLLTVSVQDACNAAWADFGRQTQPRWGTLADGTFGRQAESWMLTHGRTMRRLRPLWSELLLGLFGETPGNVVAGRRGWLFNTATLAPLDEGEAEASLQVIQQLVRASRERWASHPGGRCLLLVVPAKWRLHPDELLGPPPGGPRAALYGEILVRLRSEGVDVPDVLAAMRAARRRDPQVRFFEPNDTHVSPAGQAFLARTFVAPWTGVAPEEARAVQARLVTRTRVWPGNLTELMSIRPDSRVGRRYSVRQTSFVLPPPTNRRSADVLVLGDSHTYYQDQQFPRLIEAFTSRGVDARFTGWRGWSRLVVTPADVVDPEPDYLLLVINEEGALTTGASLREKLLRARARMR